MTTALRTRPGTPVPVTPGELLAQITDSREAARRAEVETMTACLAWVRMHPATSLEQDAAALPGHRPWVGDRRRGCPERVCRVLSALGGTIA